MSIAGVMTRDVVSVAPDDRAATVGDLLTAWEITGVPVVDTSGRVVGVVSDLDLLSALRRRADLRRTLVSEVMQPHPIFIRPDTDLHTAVELMEQWQVRRLPVCDGGRLIGIVTRGDLLRALTIDPTVTLRRVRHGVRCGSGRPCACVAAATGPAIYTTPPEGNDDYKTHDHDPTDRYRP